MKIVILGAGYVGLPLAVEFAKKHDIICFDINKQRIKDLKKGIDRNLQILKNEILKTKITFTCNNAHIKDKDIYIVTVPTPINNNQKPNLSMLRDASITVGKSLMTNSLVIYESTTYPGCTEEFCIPLIEKNSKLVFGTDFQVAYSPERVNPGDKVNILKNITKIVGANDNKTLQKVKKLYQTICKKIYTTSSIKIAESAKVIENIQRDINIAFVNELSVILNKLNIPTNEVLKAASSKWNFHYYKPGLVGGHCISVDPYYLSYRAKKENYFPRLILSGRDFNEKMASYVVKKTLELLSKNNIKLKSAKIAILGFAFKENIPDIRNSKIEKVVKQLVKKKVNVKIFDNLVSKREVKKKYSLDVNNFCDIKKFKFDAIVLAVSHKEFIKKISYYDKFYKNKKNKIFIDLKNNYKHDELSDNENKFFQL